MIDISIRDEAKDVLNIQIPSYKVEAKIIGYDEIPPLKDTVKTLQECEEIFFGYYEDKELCGAVSVKVDDKVVDIHRLIVHPTHFRKGIAQKLLNFVTRNFEAENLK